MHMYKLSCVAMTVFVGLIATTVAPSQDCHPGWDVTVRETELLGCLGCKTDLERERETKRKEARLKRRYLLSFVPSGIKTTQICCFLGRGQNQWDYRHLQAKNKKHKILGAST